MSLASLKESLNPECPNHLQSILPLSLSFASSLSEYFFPSALAYLTQLNYYSDIPSGVYSPAALRSAM